MRRFLWSIAVGLAVVGLLIGVGSGFGSPSAEPAVREVTMTMGYPNEMRFYPDRLTFRAGEVVEWTMRNDGRMLHEVLIGRELLRDERGAPERYANDLLLRFFPITFVDGDGAWIEIEPKENGVRGAAEIYLEPHGGWLTLRFTVPTGDVGEWEIGCFEPGHYEAGMKGTLVIEP